MNRSLRRLALLGLLALGVSSAGAQTTFPSLFNVTYTPSTLTLTITSTGNAASGNLPAGSSTYSMGYGVLFKNLFTAHPAPLTDVFGALNASVGGGLEASVQTPGALLNSVFDQYPQQLGLSVLSQTQNSTMTFEKGVNSAFKTGNTLTLTFNSSEVSSYLRTSSLDVAGYVNVGTGAGIDIGTYSYTYSAVPEPSTYAAIAGALGLGYAVYRRRRQAAAAATA